MRVIHKDLFTCPSDGDAICVTTNGMIKANGCAVMGAGIAKTFAFKYPGLPKILGRRLYESGNHAYYLTTAFGERNEVYHILSFPTKHDWRDKSDINLIEQSCYELVNLADKLKIRNVFFPLPGCGMGGLGEDEVYPVITRVFDDRFVLTLR